LYPKDTQKWKQFTTGMLMILIVRSLYCIPKILKNESNSQLTSPIMSKLTSCIVSQRYSKMKAIHNPDGIWEDYVSVVLYPKDTQKWKQFTTESTQKKLLRLLYCIPKILKNESNSQQINTL